MISRRQPSLSVQREHANYPSAHRGGGSKKTVVIEVVLLLKKLSTFIKTSGATSIKARLTYASPPAIQVTICDSASRSVYYTGRTSQLDHSQS